MKILELIPRATIEKLVERGLLSRKVADEAHAEISAEFARVERAMTRLEREKGRPLSRPELVRLMQSYTGEQPVGKVITRRRGRVYRQTDAPRRV